MIAEHLWKPSSRLTKNGKAGSPSSWKGQPSFSTAIFIPKITSKSPWTNQISKTARKQAKNKNFTRLSFKFCSIFGSIWCQLGVQQPNQKSFPSHSPPHPITTGGDEEEKKYNYNACLFPSASRMVYVAHRRTRWLPYWKRKKSSLALLTQLTASRMQRPENVERKMENL